MTGCAFCGIAAGDGDAFVLREDDDTVAFLDRNPAVRGHTLVAPRRHVASVFATEATAVAVIRAVTRVADALESVLEPDGVSVFFTTADLVGTVTHAHVHVLPRTHGDAVHVALDRRSLDPDRAAALSSAVHDELAGRE